MIPVLEDQIGLIVMEEWSPQWITDPPCCLRVFLGALQQCVDVGRSIWGLLQSWLSHARFSIARRFHARASYRTSWYFCAQYSDRRPGTLCLYWLRKQSDVWQFNLKPTNPSAPCNGPPAGIRKRRTERPLQVRYLGTCCTHPPRLPGIFEYFNNYSIYLGIIHSSWRDFTSRNCSNWPYLCYTITQTEGRQQLWYNRPLIPWYQLSMKEGFEVCTTIPLRSLPITFRLNTLQSEIWLW